MTRQSYDYGNARPDTLYVVTPVGFAGPYKIGATCNLPRRLRTLNNGSPFHLELLAEMPGDVILERRIHAFLRHAHMRCEWFGDCEELHQVIAAMRRGNLEELNLPGPVGVSAMVNGVSPHSRKAA